MEKKTIGTTLFLIVIIYRILHRIFFNFISSNLNYILWGIWVILLSYFIWWITKKTTYFKKIPLKERPEHRFQVAEELGIVSIGISIGYILGFVCIGLGAFALFLKKLDVFLGITILGIIVIFMMFFADKRRKKKKQNFHSK